MTEREQYWAERDLKREQWEAELEVMRVNHREAHIAIVQAVLPRVEAERAVDALLAAGVVFARISREPYD